MSRSYLVYTSSSHFLSTSQKIFIFLGIPVSAKSNNVWWSISKCVFRHAPSLKMDTFQSFCNRVRFGSSPVLYLCIFPKHNIICCSDNGPISHVTQDTCCESVSHFCNDYNFVQIDDFRAFQFMLLSVCVLQFVYNSCPRIQDKVFCT